MAIPMDAIEDRIKTLMAADSNFDGWDIMAGFPLGVPDDWFPLVEITVVSGSATSEQSGGWHIFTYSGSVRFHSPMVDEIVTDGRLHTEMAIRTLRAKINAVRTLLRVPANRDLNGLSDTGWAVREIVVSNDEDYGFNPRSERSDDYLLVGSVAIEIETQEVVT